MFRLGEGFSTTRRGCDGVGHSPVAAGQYYGDALAATRVLRENAEILHCQDRHLGWKKYKSQIITRYSHCGWAGLMLNSQPQVQSLREQPL